MGESAVKVLVTAGNTLAPIDQVRGITNIFTGRTGTLLAAEACRRGHSVCLLTSHPERAVNPLPTDAPDDRWRVRSYRTFDDLDYLMEEELLSGGHDALIHVAAVGDYRVEGCYAPGNETVFDPVTACWQASGSAISMTDVHAGKVKSNHAELWLRLVPAPKLVDKVRADWRFGGVLVKFKLEVGVGMEELCAIADQSRRHSKADLLVANTLDGMHDWALLGSSDGSFRRIDRTDLPREVIAAVENLAAR